MTISAELMQIVEVLDSELLFLGRRLLQLLAKFRIKFKAHKG
jgi:hypothetical protein